MSGSMFEQYGGFTSVHKVVMSFYDKALDSDLIGPYFERVDLRRLIDHQTKFISYLMGGPASYTNEHLRHVHAHLKISQASFDEAVGLLRETFEDFEFDPRDVDHLMMELISRTEFIVDRSAGAGRLAGVTG
jgi:hemoglobin